jgi:hypothetical protein
MRTATDVRDPALVLDANVGGIILMVLGFFGCVQQL